MTQDEIVKPMYIVSEVLNKKLNFVLPFLAIQMSRTGAPLLGCLRYSRTGGNYFRAQRDAQDTVQWKFQLATSCGTVVFSL
jgi:hypothetical protein